MPLWLQNSWVVGIGTGLIVAIIIAVVKLRKQIYRKTIYLFTRHPPHVPRKTVRIVPKAQRNRWEMGSIDGRPAMRVVGHCYVTNITDISIFLLQAYIVRPRIDGSVCVRHAERNIFGTYPILPKTVSEVIIDFFVEPAVCKEAKDFKATIVFVDQFGNKHNIKKVIFKGGQKKPQKTKKIPQEAIYSIEDPIEKEVASALKAETNRYRECGRRIGGLGSVYVIYDGKKMVGIGTECRKTGSLENQSIVKDCENASIESDNVAALMRLYHRLSNDEERSRFVSALLKRLSRGTEYSPIGYLILLVMFRIGRLPDAMSTAKRNLQNDESYGFSDLLRLLDGLLRFEHTSFTSSLLDEIEKFIEGLEEHTFRIQERVAAIRTYCLQTRKN